MNEMQISKVESRVQTELLQTTDHKNNMERLDSNYQKTIRFSLLHSTVWLIPRVDEYLMFVEVDKPFLLAEKEEV